MQDIKTEIVKIDIVMTPLLTKSCKTKIRVGSNLNFSYDL